MRRLGRRRTMATGTARGTATVLLSLSVLLTGCGGDDAADPSNPSGSPTSATASASATPSERETPAVLEGATRVEGRGITFLVAQDYELYDQRDQHPRMVGGWRRAYSVDALTAMDVTYSSTDSLTEQDLVESTRKYVHSGGATRIRRADDLTLMGHQTIHVTGRNQNVIFHSYVVLFGEYQLSIDFERPPTSPEQRRLQRAMLESFRLTEYPPPRE